MISLKNTLEAIGNKISAINSSLGNVPHRTLLWTNPNPTSAFGAQTISLDLSNYDEIEIWHSEESATMILMSRGIVGYSTELMGFRNDPFVQQRRTVTTTQNSVRFEACVLGTQLGGYYGVYNDRNIPQKIYGIKWGGGYFVVSSIARRLGVLYDKSKEHIKRYCDKYISTTKWKRGQGNCYKFLCEDRQVRLLLGKNECNERNSPNIADFIRFDNIYDANMFSILRKFVHVLLHIRLCCGGQNQGVLECWKWQPNLICRCGNVAISESGVVL